MPQGSGRRVRGAGKVCVVSGLDAVACPSGRVGEACAFFTRLSRFRRPRQRRAGLFVYHLPIHSVRRRRGAYGCAMPSSVQSIPFHWQVTCARACGRAFLFRPFGIPYGIARRVRWSPGSLLGIMVREISSGVPGQYGRTPWILCSPILGELWPTISRRSREAVSSWFYLCVSMWVDALYLRHLRVAVVHPGNVVRFVCKDCWVIFVPSGVGVTVGVSSAGVSLALVLRYARPKTRF